jgi:hypothetical protein
MKLFKRQKFEIKSNSEKNKVYTVCYIINLELWICSCACSTMSSRECSHIKEAKKLDKNNKTN